MRTLRFKQVDAFTPVPFRGNPVAVVLEGDGLSGAEMHVRSFAPSHGVPEDPVCGSGNISVAAFLRESGQAARFGAAYRARQGMQTGRDGSVSIRIGEDGIHLGGQAVTCIEGALRVQ